MAVTYDNRGLIAYINKIGDANDTAPAEMAERFSTTVRARIRGAAYRTGFLHDSVEPDGDTVTVNAHYGVYVNYGTYKMAARSFWEPSIQDFRPTVVEISTKYLEP